MEPYRIHDASFTHSPCSTLEKLATLDGKTIKRLISSNGDVKIIETLDSYPNIPPYPYFNFASSDSTFTIPARELDGNEWEEYKRKIEGEISVNIIKEKSTSDEQIITCSDENDLSKECILKTLSAMQGKFMIDSSPICFQKIECRITPLVRKNIVDASKRLKMFGKKRPIIARFDEYGNRLPDKINLEMGQGITLKIVEPEIYGEYYIELKGMEFKGMPLERIESDTSFYSRQMDELDLPF